MRANVLDDDLLLSERVLGAYAARVGKHRAQEELQTAAGRGPRRRSLTGRRGRGRRSGRRRRRGDPGRADPPIPTAEVAVDVVTERVTRLLDATEKSWP